MSDLSFAELDAEHGELLPERETLAVIQVNIGAVGAIGIGNSDSLSQSNAVGSNVGSFDDNALGSYNGDHVFVL